MRTLVGFSSFAVCLALTACGGGGTGGVSSTPTPVPTPTPAPTPTPSPTPSPTPTPVIPPIANLQTSQTFGGEATTTNVTLAVPSAAVQSTTQIRDVVSVSYNAGSQSYTLTTAGRNQTFGPADAVAAQYEGETRYSKAGDREYLTLVTNPYFGAEFSNRYVGMGYWQKNTSPDPNTQQTVFSTFVFGFNTQGTGVPRSGAAHWLTDIFGIYSVQGNALRTIQGLGDLEVDFADSAFRASGYMNEYEVVTDQGGSGGALTFQAGGSLSSDGTFSGLFSYSGHFSDILHGTLSGSFFGPNAEEIGATFNASGGASTLTGALTGQKYPVGSTSDGIKNISLTNLLTTELLRGQSGVTFFATTDDGQTTGFKQVSAGQIDAQLTLTPEGITSVQFSQNYRINPLEIIQDGRTNFTTYRSVLSGIPVTVSLYKIGHANQELALTYTSFVSWFAPRDTPSSRAFENHFATYGFETPRDLLTNRQGTAAYNGVVYGKGGTVEGTIYDIGGTSRFDVNFSAATYSGWLDIQGTTTSGASSNFGRFTFGASVAAGTMLQSPLTGATSPDGGSYIQPRFYGPTGQEIGASFTLRMGDPDSPGRIQVGGITVAKAQ